MSNANNNILVVDLDNSLIKIDLLVEAIFYVLFNSPLKLICLIGLFFRSKAKFKCEISKIYKIDPTEVPYNSGVINFLQGEKLKDRYISLVSASNESWVGLIADHLKLFDEHYGSNDVINLKGKSKYKFIKDIYGEGNFSYIGDSFADRAIWKNSTQKYICSNFNLKLFFLSRLFHFDKIFPATKRSFIRNIALQLRIHQWVKNILIFVPLMASHMYTNLGNWGVVATAALCFCLVSSSFYIFNDILDIHADRAHSKKRFRPLASGEVQILPMFIVSFLLLVSGLTTASLIFQINFVFVLILYAILNFLYSSFLKKLALVDVVVLSMLYTIRIVAGTFALALPLSFWLCTFSLFVFLSLAYGKRFAELHSKSMSSSKSVARRGYNTDDMNIVLNFGIVSGMVSTLIFALYLNDYQTQVHYTNPQFMWVLIPVLVLWITRFWHIAGHGKLYYDPIVFAIRDKFSLVVLIVFVMTTILSK